jgi:hypothetical protein
MTTTTRLSDAALLDEWVLLRLRDTREFEGRDLERQWDIEDELKRRNVHYLPWLHPED